MDSEQEQEESVLEEDQTHAILQNVLRQNHQNPIILPLTQTLIEAILGGELQVRDILHHAVVTESETEEEEIEASLRRHYSFNDDDEELPSPKRLRYMSRNEVSYFFKLSSGEEFYYTEEDIKPTLLHENLEPNPIVRIIIGNMPIGIKNRLNYLAKFRFDEMEEEDSDIDEDEIGNAIIKNKPRQFDNVCIQVFSAYMKEMKLRAIFRRVWALWKVYRLNKLKEDDMDPITLSPPVKRVILYEPNKKYVFDATSLATWIESKLHYQEYGFAVPMYPCNPWTNVEFSYIQLISIYYQLKSYGELRWGFITLKQHDFNKKMWSLYHKSALTMKAIRTNLWSLENSDARDMLEDFIFAMFDELRIHTSSRIINAYRQAIRRTPQHWYLEKWKALAFEHLEGEHLGQNRRSNILNASVMLLKKQELFFKELIQSGIMV